MPQSSRAGSHLLIASMLANPALANTDIAKLLKISPRTVSRVKTKLQATLQKKQGENIELETYRMQLRERVPARKRVDTLAKAMNKVESNPFVALRAVDMVDQRLGLVKSESNEPQESKAQPMFVLPPGSEVTVNVLNAPNALVTMKKSDNDI